MALTIVGSASAAATSVAIPTHAVGDLILVWAYRDGSTAIPTVPTASGTVPAWVAINTAVGGNTNSAASYQFQATATTTTTGTWTNATGIAVVVLRGHNPTTPIGRNTRSTGSTVNAVSVPAVAPTYIDGSSQFISFMGHRTVTAWSAATAGYNRETSVATEVAVNSKTTRTSGGSYTQACTATVSGWMAEQIEVLAAVDTSTGKYRNQTAGSGHTGSGGFGAQTATFAKAVLSGSLLVCKWVGNSDAGNATCADNVNGAWLALTQQTPFVGSGRRDNWFYKLASASATAGSMVVTVTPNSAAGNSESMQIMEYVGFGELDTAVTAYATQASGTAYSQVSGTPTQTGDLILASFSADGEAQGHFTPVSPMTGAVLDANGQIGGKSPSSIPFTVVELIGASTSAVTTAMTLSTGDDGGKYVIGFAPASATPPNLFMPFMGGT